MLLFASCGRWYWRTLCGVFSQWCHWWILKFFGSCCLVDLIFFLVLFIWTLGVAIDGGRCLLIRFIVMLCWSMCRSILSWFLGGGYDSLCWTVWYDNTVPDHILSSLPSSCLLIDVLGWGLVVVLLLDVSATCQPLLWGFRIGLFLLFDVLSC